MENVTDDKVKERENLVACATNILKNVGDNEVLESIVELLQDLPVNAAMQQGLKNFKKNGWAFIRKTKDQDRNDDSNFRSTPTIFSTVRDLEKINLHLDSRLDEYYIDDLGWVHIRKTLKPLGQNLDLDYDAELLHGARTSSSMMLELDQEKLNSEGRRNPLNIELILRNIFEYCSVSDLKECRLVSKTWRDVSLSFWRRKAVLQTERLFEDEDYRNGSQFSFYDDDDIDDEDCYNIDVGSARGSMETFIKNGSKFMELPFQRYKIGSCDTFINSCSPTEIKKTTLEFFTTSIQHLTIKCEDLEILFMVLTNLPELRVLHLQIDCQPLFEQYESMISEDRKCPFQDLQPRIFKLCKLDLKISVSSPEINPSLPFLSLWKKIFEKAPALKSFRLSSWSRTIFTEIIRTIWEIRQEGSFSTINLEELDIPDPLNRYPLANAGRIIDCKFPIRTLQINLRKGYNPSTFSDLLEAHSETLEYMKCDIYSFDENEPEILLAPYFPIKVKLPILKECVLNNDCNCEQTLNFLCSLDVPQLEKLTIGESSYQSTESQTEGRQRNIIRLVLESENFMGSLVFPNLKKFFYNEPWNLSAKSLEILSKAMPNLTDLSIPLWEHTFPNVYKLWPGLQSLHVLATELTFQLIDDYTITGIPYENYCDEDKTGSRGPRPNITDLKNLRKFVVETRLQGSKNLLRNPRGLITDLSAVYGFLLLPQLQVLQIESVCKFSPKVMMALENHISEMKIYPPNIYQRDGDDQDLLRDEAVYDVCGDSDLS